jgi:hypothetical protein
LEAFASSAGLPNEKLEEVEPGQGHVGHNVNNKLGLDQKELLDEIGFAWKADTVPTRSSTTDVSCR